jgi:hypothetical protein
VWQDRPGRKQHKRGWSATEPRWRRRRDEDTGNAPGTLVASTAIAPISQGTNEISVTTQIDLAPGRYWLLALYDVETQIALKTPYTPIWYQKMGFADSLPATFPVQASSVGTYTEKYFGYYLVGMQ